VLAGIITGLVEHLINFILEGLHHRASWLGLERLFLKLGDECLHLRFGSCDRLIDNLHCASVCHCVADTD